MNSKKPIIITIIAVILLIGGGVTYVVMSGMLNPPVEEVEQEQVKPDLTTGDAYKVQLEEKKVEVESLVAAGDEESIKQAEEIVKTEVKTAQASGNTSYLVDARLAQAVFMIDIGQAQEALDTILLPMEKEYQGNETYIYQIYGTTSYAYKWLDNGAKAEEYLDKIPPQGWDE